MSLPNTAFPCVILIWGGGGLGVTYQDEQPPAVADYIAALLARLQDYPHLSLYLEPGRAIVANAGVLLTRVEYLKSNGFKTFHHGRRWHE